MSHNQREGKQGEEYAVKFLQKNGYKILERNFKIRYGEIDIVAIDKEENTLVFIEVKTRSNSEFGTPLESITYFKLQSVIKTARVYKLSHPKTPELMRIDAVSVVVNPYTTFKLEHIKNISGF